MPELVSLEPSHEKLTSLFRCQDCQHCGWQARAVPGVERGDAVHVWPHQGNRLSHLRLILLSAESQHKHTKPRLNLSLTASDSPVNALQQVRKDLNGHLTKLNGDRDWSFVLNQVGMFSFTGLNKVYSPSFL